MSLFFSLAHAQENNAFNVCSIMPAFNAITNFIISIAVPLAVLIIAWGGVQIMTAAGASENLERGKKAILYSAIGLIGVFSVHSLLPALFNAINVNIGQWQC